ncbi:MAG: hypothetical protein ABR992_15295 [Solirubrobacteraceae bacterium]|jgi:hypothetical protein
MAGTGLSAASCSPSAIFHHTPANQPLALEGQQVGEMLARQQCAQLIADNHDDLLTLAGALLDLRGGCLWPAGGATCHAGERNEDTEGLLSASELGGKPIDRLCIDTAALGLALDEQVTVKEAQPAGLLGVGEREVKLLAAARGETVAVVQNHARNRAEHLHDEILKQPSAPVAVGRRRYLVEYLSGCDWVDGGHWWRQATGRRAARPQTERSGEAQIAEADRAIAMQVRALEQGIEPDIVRARIEELKAEKSAAQASLPKLGLAPERQDPAALLDQVPNLSERLRDADDATKRALFDAFDLRVVYDKTSDRLSISATLTEAVASMLRTGPLDNGLETLSQQALRGTDSHNCTTVTHAYPLSKSRLA